jgi:hypothetical protein
MSTLPAADTRSRACGGARLAIERTWLPRASLAEKARFAALVPLDLLLRLACARFETFLALFERLTPAFLDWTGRWRARAIFYRAARTVPAYRRNANWWLPAFRSRPEGELA